MKLTNFLKRIKLHNHKQNILALVSGILSGLITHQISGQNALKKCLRLADKFNITTLWEKHAHIVESSVYANIYKKSIQSYDDESDKNKDRLAWYYLRKYNQPFIYIMPDLSWTPIKHQSQYDKAVIALKNLISNS